MSTPKPPQPSWLLKIGSILVVVGCLLPASAAVDSLYLTDLFLKVVSFIAFLSFASVGLIQYCGTFRRHAEAAYAAAICLYAAGGFLLFGTITNAGEFLLKSKGVPQLWAVLLISALLLIGGAIIYQGWINHHWSKQLKAYYGNLTGPYASNRFTLRELIGAISVLAVIICLGMTLHRSTLPQHALHATRSEVAFPLPKNASDISYCQGGQGLGYEFTTDEQSFIDWVNTEIITADARLFGVTLQPITQQAWIFRYHHLSPYLAGPSEEIAKGLVYEFDDHPPVKAIYDRDTGRAYYFSGYPNRYR